MTEEKRPKASYDTLTHPARSFEEAEAMIRLLIRDNFLRVVPSVRLALDAKARKIIQGALMKVKSKDLQNSAKKSLWAFYIAQYRAAQSISRADRLLLLACISLSDSRNRPSPNGISLPTVQQSARILSRSGYDVSGAGAASVQINGVPAMQFQEDFFKKRIKPTFERLLELSPKDPDDLSGRNTLRNLAEMTVRYEEHQADLEGLKARGVRLVVASSHSDASERCRPWQNRVYSLDGTSGTAPDGRRFIPLERATDIPYTTKAGKVYMNGLLGFNCRHYLVEYRDNLRFTRQDDAEELKQYKITVRQRQMERTIREYKTRAMMAKYSDPKEYYFALRKSEQWTHAYRVFSEKNGRPWYKSRTTLI